MIVLYSDMLHRMSSVEAVIDSLIIRTLVVIVVTGVSLGIVIIKAKANRNDGK